MYSALLGCAIAIALYTVLNIESYTYNTRTTRDTRHDYTLHIWLGRCARKPRPRDLPPQARMRDRDGLVRSAIYYIVLQRVAPDDTRDTTRLHILLGLGRCTRKARDIPP